MVKVWQGRYKKDTRHVHKHSYGALSQNSWVEVIDAAFLLVTELFGQQSIPAL